MAQINKKKVVLQQNDRNILSDVEICPDLEQHWFDALGQFASMMRLQHGMNHVVHIENEVGAINSTGELVVTVGVSNETLEMAFPKGTWEFKQHA